SIPFGYLLVRLRTGGDVRRQGSGNIGATNVLRTAGKSLGILTLMLDAAKGWVAMQFVLRWHPTPAWAVAAALLLVILGHIYSPWIRFRGGNGVATGLGAFLALAPWALLVSLAVFAVVAWISRYVSLASICACVALPLLLLTPLHGSAVSAMVKACAAAAAVLIIARHHANIARLLRGTENRLGGGRHPAVERSAS
ncbi:MAG: glycerol-3-phosphate 1-O-acyltransferase PlsY, partial [Terriglobales bacterium]